MRTASDPSGASVRLRIAADGRDRAVSALIVVTCILAAAALYYIKRDNAPWLPPCPFHWLTELYCPGCGSSRAILRMLHGDITGAIAANVLVVVCVPAVAIMVVSNACTAITGRMPGMWRLPAWGAWAVCIGIVAFWVLRNLPVYPLSLLAPR